jgi:uncharacterized protein YjbI with pentapeptide repeats
MTQHTTSRRALAAAALSLALAVVGVAVVDGPASAATCPTVALNGTVSPAAAPGVNWSGCNLGLANLTGADLAGADLSSASFAGAHLVGANLSSANLSGAALQGAFLTNSDLTSADLTGAVLTGTWLQGATLTNATIAGADVAGVSLGRSTTARLRSGGLVGAPSTALPLPWALISGHLVGPGSDLTGAQLQDNDFSGLDLTGADLTNANLSLDTNLDSATWTDAIWTGATCPDGTIAGARVDGTCLTPVDSTPPVARMTAPTGAFAASLTVLFAWVPTETGSGVALSHYRLARSAAGGGARSAWSTSSLSASWPFPKGVQTVAPGYRYCFEAQLKDKAGNLGPWAAPACTTVPFDDRAFTASKGWVRGKGSAWSSSTYTSTTLVGRTLITPRSATVRQLALIATQCSTCGSVALYVGKVRVVVVSLRSAKLHNRALIVLPHWSTARAGRVTLVVTSKGKLVRIDSIGISAA